MSGKQAKRYRELEGRVALLEAQLQIAEDLYAAPARREARAARWREWKARKREHIWRGLALVAVAAAILATLVAAVLLSVVREVEAQELELEPTAVVCRGIGGAAQ